MSARGMPHARLDVHVGPGSTHHLFCGLSGPILFVSWLGRPVHSLAVWRPPVKRRRSAGQAPRRGRGWFVFRLPANPVYEQAAPANERLTQDVSSAIRNVPLSLFPSSTMSRRLFRVARSATGLGLFA